MKGTLYKSMQDKPSLLSKKKTRLRITSLTIRKSHNTYRRKIVGIIKAKQKGPDYKQGNLWVYIMPKLKLNHSNWQSPMSQEEDKLVRMKDMENFTNKLKKLNSNWAKDWIEICGRLIALRNGLKTTDKGHWLKVQDGQNVPFPEDSGFLESFFCSKCFWAK